MIAIECLFWVAAVWSVFFLYVLVDAPTLLARWIGGRR